MEEILLREHMMLCGGKWRLEGVQLCLLYTCASSTSSQCRTANVGRLT